MARRTKPKRIRKRRPGKHLRATTQGMRFVNRMTFVFLVGTCCVAVAALAVPQVRHLRSMKEELVRAEAHELHSIEQKDRMTRELDSVKSDPSYLELIARDRLDLCREGEKVIRIRR